MSGILTAEGCGGGRCRSASRLLIVTIATALLPASGRSALADAHPLDSTVHIREVFVASGDQNDNRTFVTKQPTELLGGKFIASVRFDDKIASVATLSIFNGPASINRPPLAELVFTEKVRTGYFPLFDGTAYYVKVHQIDGRVGISISIGKYRFG